MDERSLFREMNLLRAAYDELSRAERRVEEQFDATMTGGSPAAVSRSVNRVRGGRSG